jgi:hypothetical protein
MPLADSRSHSRNSSDCGEDQKAIPGANIHETNRRLLVHLCLGVDVNIVWIDLPEDVRRLILHRICGRPSQMSTKLQLWLAQSTEWKPPYQRKAQATGHQLAPPTRYNNLPTLHLTFPAIQAPRRAYYATEWVP